MSAPKSPLQRRIKKPVQLAKEYPEFDNNFYSSFFVSLGDIDGDKPPPEQEKYRYIPRPRHKEVYEGGGQEKKKKKKKAKRMSEEESI